MNATDALVRRVSRSLADCALTHVPRQKIDPAVAAAQHQGYVDALTAAGLRVRVLPEEPALPDATFVEDLAVMLDEGIVICRPGCASREAEIASLTPVLQPIGKLHTLHSPATLDGGDVLVVDRTLFVGASARTNAEGIRQLESVVQQLGYRVVPIPVSGCLHLKTAIGLAAPGVLIANPRWIDVAPFSAFEVLVVPEAEPWGANVLRVNDQLLTAASSPRTADLLRARGLKTQTVDITELQKAEAGLTCLSLIWSAPTCRSFFGGRDLSRRPAAF